MALTIQTPTTEPIDLSECVLLLSELGALPHRERLDDAAVYLRMLANNKSFLVELVNQQIRCAEKLDAYQAANDFPQQVIDLGRGPKFRLRANLWPRCQQEAPTEWERNLFAYQMPHDHDADFLTVGYWGPGYETEIYEYDSSKVTGYDGEQVELRFLERTYLETGKVMFYRKNCDIHTQLPPQAFSISINLLIAQPDGTQSTNQYWFDVERGLLKSAIDRLALTPFLFVCKLAAMIGDASTVDLLDSVARRHANPKVRAQAWASLLALDADNTERHMQRGLQDPHPYVHREVLGAVSGEGSSA